MGLYDFYRWPQMLVVHNRFKTSNMGWVGQIKDKREPVHHEAEAGKAASNRQYYNDEAGLKGNELRKWKRAPLPTKSTVLLSSLLLLEHGTTQW